MSYLIIFLLLFPFNKYEYNKPNNIPDGIYIIKAIYNMLYLSCKNNKNLLYNFFN